MGKYQKEEQAPMTAHYPMVLCYNVLKEKEASKRSMTSLQGYVTTTYDYITRLFGPPTCRLNDKVTCEWVLEFDDGSIVTLYDYKEGTTPTDEYAWHIGGHGPYALQRIKESLGLPVRDRREHV
jgi:hypothetical protein